MTSIQSLLVLVAATWASTNSIFAAIKYLNELRDKIVIGLIDGKPMELDHRQFLFNNDWKPIIVSCSLICFAFFIIIVLLPFFVVDHKYIFIFLCFVVSVFPLSSFIGFAIYGYKDYKYIQNKLSEHILDDTHRE